MCGCLFVCLCVREREREREREKEGKNKNEGETKMNRIKRQSTTNNCSRNTFSHLDMNSQYYPFARFFFFS